LVLHLGHVFSRVRWAGGFVFAVFAFFSAARRCRRGASAWTTEHCGWMPADEYECSPQTGHVFGTGPARKGVALFLFMWRLRASYAFLYIGFECAESCLVPLHREMKRMQQPLCSEKVRNDPLRNAERLSRCAEWLRIQTKIDK
jgi:hypothetical protein